MTPTTTFVLYAGLPPEVSDLVRKALGAAEDVVRK